MAAALPYVDALVSGHSLDALYEVVEAIGADHVEREIQAPEPEEEEPWASATPVAGQLGGDAERLRAEQGEDDARMDRSEDLHLPRLRTAGRAAAPARRPAAGVLRPRGPQRADRAPGARCAWRRRVEVADEAYRAVFLRVHPTGKMVLSLTTEADGNEGEYAQLVADELGVPALDVKVVPADENRFGAGHGFNTSPSPGTRVGDRERDGEDPRQGAAAGRRGARGRRDSLNWDDGAFVGRRRVAHDRRHRALRPRLRRAAAGRRGRPRRPDGVPRLMRLGPENGTLTVRTGRGGAAAKAGHDLVIEVERWSATLDDARRSS